MTDLLLVVPPAALSMAGGPPAAVTLLRDAFDRAGLRADILDGNVAFFRRLLEPDARRAVAADIDRRLKPLLGAPSLDADDLSTLGRLLHFREGEKLRQELVPRTGMGWAGVDDVLSGAGSDAGTRALAERLWTDALDAIAHEILDRRPGAVAFSVLLEPQIRGFLGLGQRLADAGFTGPRLAGGAVLKLAEEQQLLDLLRRARVPLAWRADLFDVPPALAAWIRGAGPLSEVRGGGAVVTEPEVRVARDFAGPPPQLPGPGRWGGLSRAHYLPPHIFPVLVSVGCYWGRCDFCDYPYLATRSPGSATTRFRRPESVAEDLLVLRGDLGVPRVDLISDAVPYGWFERLDEVAGEQLRDAGPELECSMRAEVFARPSHFAAMARVGLRAVTLGVEVLHDDVLAGMAKGNTVEDVLRCAQMAHDAGLRVKANLIVDHPRIRAEHLPAMLASLERLAPLLDALGVHRFSLSPHAPIFADLGALGLRRVPGRRATDHGSHALEFVRDRPDPARDAAVARLAEEAEALMYELENRTGRAPGRGRVMRLPYSWRDGRADRVEDGGDLHVLVPAERGPFRFFVGANARTGDAR